jgi:hypothetical protein
MSRQYGLIKPVKSKSNDTGNVHKEQEDGGASEVAVDDLPEFDFAAVVSPTAV